jgi:hypothetical protein
MRSLFARTVLWTFLLLSAGADLTQAQSMFLTPYSARNLGMGFSGVADDFDPGNAFYNPAVLGALHGIAFRADLRPNLRYSGDDNLGWSSFLAGGYRATPRVLVAVGFTYTRWDWDDNTWWARSEQNVAPSAALSYGVTGSSTISFGFGQKNWKRESDYTNDSKATVYDSGLLYSGVTQTKTGKHIGYSFGVAYHNWGGEITRGDYRSPPTTEFRAGAGFRITRPATATGNGGKSNPPADWHVSINTDYARYDDYRRDQFLAGVEYSFHEIGFLRAGYLLTTGVSTVHKITLGAGVGYDTGRFRIRVDYARAPARHIDYDTTVWFNFVGLYLGYSFEPRSDG